MHLVALAENNENASKTFNFRHGSKLYKFFRQGGNILVTDPVQHGDHEQDSLTSGTVGRVRGCRANIEKQK